MASDKYSKYYSEESLFEKIKSVFSKAGVSVIYGVLLLFYTLKDPTVSWISKATIVGALGYFIAPIDLIPDSISMLGYTDDLTVITKAISTISASITPETQRKAKKKILEWFSSVKNDDFSIIDNLIPSVE